MLVTDRAAAQGSEATNHLDEHGGWPTLLTSLLDGVELSAAGARAAMRTILDGHATPAQLIGFVVALRAKGETAEELSGLLDAVLEFADLVPLSDETKANAIDIVGTGGDRSHSINVSTIAALITAGAGVTVCKHGARAASSKCGAADVLEALGVVIDLDAEGVARCIDDVGIGFCFAPKFHPAFRFAAPSRREIGIPTVFNLLGPMANPGRVRRQVLGVADESKADEMIASLNAHGSTHAWVVHGGGLDELSTTGPSTVHALDPDGVRTFTVDPVTFGMKPALLDQLAGGDPSHNAAVVRRVLDGEHGPARDITLLNAGAALVVAGRADTLTKGIELAASTVDDGLAAETLDRFVTTSQRLAAEASDATASASASGD